MNRSKKLIMVGAMIIIGAPTTILCRWSLPIHNQSNAQVDVHLFFDSLCSNTSFYLDPKQSKGFGVGYCNLVRVELRSGGKTVIAALDINKSEGNPSRGIIITQNPSGGFAIVRAK